MVTFGEEHIRAGTPVTDMVRLRVEVARLLDNE